MLKNKYQRLTKEEKKEACQKFYQTEFGKKMKPVFKRLLIISILLFIYALVLVLDSLLKKGSIWNYVAAILVASCAFVFLIGRHKIIVRDVNNFLISKDKKK